MAEANKRLELELDAKNNSQAFDIEVLNGNESEVIEMDLMLGVADLHTPEAVAAAESAIAGSNQPAITVAGGGGGGSSSSGRESDDSGDNSDHYENDDNETSSPSKLENPTQEKTILLVKQPDIIDKKAVKDS